MGWGGSAPPGTPRRLIAGHAPSCLFLFIFVDQPVRELRAGNGLNPRFFVNRGRDFLLFPPRFHAISPRKSTKIRKKEPKTTKNLGDFWRFLETLGDVWYAFCAHPMHCQDHVTHGVLGSGHVEGGKAFLKGHRRAASEPRP